MASHVLEPNAPPPGNESGRSLPPWIRVRVGAGDNRARTRRLVEGLRLNTVCQEAHCPNIWECWGRGTATFMILGDRCTRACGFCAVDTRRPLPPDPDEPERVAEAVASMGLRYAVITSVARDDLPDEGAAHFARVIEAVRAASPGIVIEVLTPDFNAREELVDTVLEARPDVFNHNIETVRRLQDEVRSVATYEGSLSVLRHAGKAGDGVTTKSGLMLGLGESQSEIEQTLRDLRQAGCSVVTIGQYLRPSPKHLPVRRWAPPEEFQEWGRRATAMGFAHVASGPMVRSSYHAEDFAPHLAGPASALR